MMKRKKSGIPFIGAFVMRPRLVFAIAAAVACFFLLPAEGRVAARLLMSWDLGVALHLLLTAAMMTRATQASIKKRAASEDTGGLVILGLTVIGVAASLWAILYELVIAKGAANYSKPEALALVATTVILSWVFMQTIFALHYAHAYYKDGDGDEKSDGGLDFPHDKKPDYWDFVYFSFIIGTAAQTADVNIISKNIRRVVTVQCVTVFFFNTSILALAVNIGAGMAS